MKSESEEYVQEGRVRKSAKPHGMGTHLHMEKRVNCVSNGDNVAGLGMLLLVYYMFSNQEWKKL